MLFRSLTSLIILSSLGACSSSSHNAPDSGNNGASSATDGDTEEKNTAGAASGVSSTAGLPIFHVEESDPAVCGSLATISGKGPMSHFEAYRSAAASISWIVDVAEAGTYSLQFTHQSSVLVPAQIWIAHKQSAELELTAPAAQGSANLALIEVQLEAGPQHISLRAATPDGLPVIYDFAVQGAAAQAGDCSSYSPAKDLNFDKPTLSEASVHDPSVLLADNQFYVFGSHLAAAKTHDLMNWTQVAADGVTAQNPLFDDVVSELAPAFAWSNVQGLWAADVLQLKSTGRYLMYYNSCEGSSPRSAMGIASSSHVEGPYEDDGIFLYSGMWGETSPDGSIYNPLVHPNAIDPDVFYDQENKLWMLYGSYSGGIFILQLDPNNGEPLPNQGYGTHLLGGNHAPIEGPFMQYSHETGYYYLFTSYGGLDSTGGYNMRIARSRSPQGPFVDAAGTDQRTVKANPEVPLFDTLTIAPSGVKIMGNHVWAGTNGQQGYVSAGHNSTYYDETSGRYFLIFHTRFPGRGEAHQLRVHEMFPTVDGWLTVAPLRYAPRSSSSELSAEQVEYIGLSEVSGNYQVLNHKKDISADIKESESVSFNADGSISGAHTGSWTFGGNNLLRVQLQGQNFQGVLSRQYNEASESFQITFSGINSDGQSLWALRDVN